MSVTMEFHARCLILIKYRHCSLVVPDRKCVIHTVVKWQRQYTAMAKIGTKETQRKVDVIKIIRNTIHVIELHRIRNGLKELKCSLRVFSLSIAAGSYLLVF